MVGTTGALGLAEGRAEAVRQALEAGTLPSLRGKGKARPARPGSRREPKGARPKDPPQGDGAPPG